jgi:hypothetical protein
VVSALDAHPSTIAEPAGPSTIGGPASTRSDYWLEHSEGFQVFGPNGRIGFVALALSSDEGVGGLVVRTGLFRTRSVFVPVHEVGSIVARRQRLELLVAPRVPRARISDIVRELLAQPVETFPRDEAGAVLNPSGGMRAYGS